MKVPCRVAALCVLFLPLITSCSTTPVTKPPSPNDALPLIVPAKAESPIGLLNVPMKPLRPSPGDPTDVLDSPGSYGDESWLKHSVDGGDNGTPPFSAFATARNDWFGLLGRPAFGTGKWVPYGPTNAMNDLSNLFRDRTTYNPGTENFGGRTVHGVISPACKPEPEDCTMWIAASNGGLWRTDNALAVDDPATSGYEGPSWEFVSGTFENQNTAALELDPNDPNHKTIWAGTGEPNNCSSGCEVGVGLYQSKDGRKGWKGPLGSDVFAGRGIGSIAVKPGDSKTLFVASGRATRGISNTCCGGTDGNVPGAPHFGVYRSTDEGKTWLLVNQGANALCTASTPDAVAGNTTACSPRGARRVKIDPVDPNTVYASFFSRGIWRSRSNGDPGTWEQIMAPLGPVGVGERAEFDVVVMPNGETRMYVGVGGGQVVVTNPPNPPQTFTLSSFFRRNDAVRNTAAATAQATWTNLPQFTQAYCDGQCGYDNYVYAPANPRNAPNSGANHDVVYLSGSNQYNENNTGTGRSNGRAVLLSTDGGVTFTDMTEDNRSSTHPGALHPDHHALFVSPLNWRQFFDLGDGGVNRSDGVFVDDTADCVAPPHAFANPANLAYCKVMLSRVPQTLNAINRGLNTLAMYTADYDRNNPDRLVAGTQDNGSWESADANGNWVNVYIADGGPSRFDATGTDSNFMLSSAQSGYFFLRYNALQQFDANYISHTLLNVAPFGLEAVGFIAPAESDPVTPGWLWTGREHVYRSTNWGRNPLITTKEQHRALCNLWTGVTLTDLNGDGVISWPFDGCDDWRPLGDPSPNGRLTAPTYGATRAGGYVSATQRAHSDSNTLWAATSNGRIFISKNADNPNPAAVAFIRLDTLDPKAPPRFPTDIFVDRTNPNHAWITYSGYNSKTPQTPGHVFEVFYHPPTSHSDPPQGVFTVRDGHKINGYGDIPANAIIQTNRGTLYVATDYGVVVKEPNSEVWKMTPAGMPNIDVTDLIYVPEHDALYAATHGQGVWKLKVQ